MSNILELAKLTQKTVPVLILERRRLEFALAKSDKEGKREIEKSLIHLYFDLADLNEILPQVSGEPVESCVWDYEEWFYEDVLSEEEVHRKLLSFYETLVRFRKAMDALVSALNRIAPNKYFSHLAGHLFLTQVLLKHDIERITGAELQT